VGVGTGKKNIPMGYPGHTLTGGSSVELYDLAGYASLGFWSAAHIFQPPEEMYCLVPCGVQEAQSMIRFLIHFLHKPSNSYKLWDFHLSLHGSDPLLLMPEFNKL